MPVFDSSSLVGALLAGLVFNTGSLSAYYNREGAAGAGTAISLVTATKGTWTSSGFVAVDGTNLPGIYELHIPDAALAAGAKSVVLYLKGAANMVPVVIVIELTATSNQDGAAGGMSRIDAAITSRPTLAQIEGSAVIAKESTLLALGQLPQTAHVFTAGEKIVVARGDKVDLPFALGALHDCTGKKLFFCAKQKATDTVPVINVECTLTDALNVIGTVPLTPALLAAVLSGVYEYERRDGDGTSNPHTIVQGPFQIAQDVRQ